jgi:hypothetical protein
LRVCAFIGDNVEEPKIAPKTTRQTEREQRLADAGVKYDKFVDDFVSWIDKDERLFTGDNGGNGGDGAGDGTGGGGGGDGDGAGGDRQKPIAVLPWIASWFAVLHLGYVVGEWKGYGQFSTAELMAGLSLAWGLVWTAIELFKAIPHTHIISIGLGLHLGTFLWTARRANEGFWDRPLAVNTLYSLFLSWVFGRITWQRFQMST